MTIMCDQRHAKYHFFNHSNSRYKGDDHEMLTRILHFSLNKSIQINTDHCYNENLKGFTSRLVYLKK